MRKKARRLTDGKNEKRKELCGFQAGPPLISGVSGESVPLAFAASSMRKDRKTLLHSCLCLSRVAGRVQSGLSACSAWVDAYSRLSTTTSVLSFRACSSTLLDEVGLQISTV